jgi:hypothetical protein
MFDEPVLIAVPPKGGSFDDCLKRLSVQGWLAPELVAALRSLLKSDKRRVKLEEGLISLWHESGCTAEGAMRAADRSGHDLGDIEAALQRMRRWQDEQGRTRLDYASRAAVEHLLAQLHHDPDPWIRDAASCVHLQLDLTRPGRPARMVFNQTEFEVLRPGRSPVRAVLIGTDHEVTPTWLRTHKRDLSLTCYDAFQNTLIDVLDTGTMRGWRDLQVRLQEGATPVRILGTLGLDDYLGHCVLMGPADAARARALIAAGATRRWGEAGDPKRALLAGRTVLIDPAYAETYQAILPGLRLEPGPKDLERACAEDGQVGIYIVRSGSTVAMMPGLCVVGEELITSETIVAVNQDRMERNPGVRVLVDALAPSQDDHAPAWRAALARRLGDRRF